MYDSKPYEELFSPLRVIAGKWDIGVVDLCKEPSFNKGSEEDFSRYMNYPIHPTLEVYK